MKLVIVQLEEILKLLKLRPESGWGHTNIEWRDGEIYLTTKTESYRPEDLN